MQTTTMNILATTLVLFALLMPVSSALAADTSPEDMSSDCLAKAMRFKQAKKIYGRALMEEKEEGPAASSCIKQVSALYDKYQASKDKPQNVLTAKLAISAALCGDQWRKMEYVKDQQRSLLEAMTEDMEEIIKQGDCRSWAFKIRNDIQEVQGRAMQEEQAIRETIASLSNLLRSLRFVEE